MNNIALISCFCDNDNKLQVLKKNLKILKENNISTALISPLPIPQEISDISNYTFITQENPILNWPIKAIGYWIKYHGYKLFTTVPDWGYTGLNHVKRLGEIFINYDYDYFNYLIYDTILTPEVIQILKEGHPGIVFPSKRKEKIWKVGLHLLSFNKSTLKNFLELITLESYLKHEGFDTYDYLYTYIVSPLNLEIGSFPVEDEVYFNNNEDIVNHSPTQDFRMFISSPDDRIETLKIFFYNLPQPIELEFNVNGILNKFLVSNGTVFNTKVLKNNLKSISIGYKEVTYDLLDTVKEIKHTIIESFD